MKRNNRFIIGLFTFLLLASACTDEQEDITGGKPDVQGKTVGLTISSQPLKGNGAFTRASGDGMDISLGGETEASTRAVNEEDIKNICVFQFEGIKEASSAVLKAKTYLSDLVDKKVEISLQPSTQSFLYVCANVDNITGSYVVDSSTFQDLIDASLAIENGQGDFSSLLPMSGSSAVFNSNTTTDIAVTLTRMVAKVTFTCDLSKLPSGATFSITSAKLRNVPTKANYYQSAGSDAIADVETYVGVGTENAVAKTTTYTWYMPENRKGTGSAVSDWTERIEKNAPLYSTYIELVGNYTASAGGETYEATFVVYMGNATDKDNYDVERNHHYQVTSAIKGINLADQRVTIDTNLSADGLANCYLASKDNHWYRFNGAVRGNGNSEDYAQATYSLPMLPDGGVSITGVTKAFVVWETSEGLINKVEWDAASSCVKFKTGEAKGNALIAVSDGTNILWSWHIWRTDGVDLAELNKRYVLDIETNTNRAWYTGGTVNAGADAGRVRPLRIMDRNLGAAFAGDIDSEDFKGAYSLHYQFGRKDPFPGGNTYSTTSGLVNGDVTLYGYGTGSKATFTIAAKKATAPGGNAKSTILNTIQKPEVFYMCSPTPYNWISTASVGSNDWKISNCLWGDENTMNGALNAGFMDNKPWDGKKTIYDPSPYGWRVAPADVWTGIANTTITSWISIPIANIYKTSNWSSGAPWGHTVYFNNKAADSKTFLPASGYRHYGEGTLYNVGTDGYGWLSSPGGQSSVYGSYLSFNSGSLGVAGENGRAIGFPVRCVQE